ncbi:hypothetical protein V6N11_043859 [Hibiscus sabdariffa]|uniref:Uncharacterized protein n=1 Tax=Hibiscus sabdariffa TaxID=183260 RepID=A0ABR2RDH1_9ROSI
MTALLNCMWPPIHFFNLYVILSRGSSKKLDNVFKDPAKTSLKSCMYERGPSSYPIQADWISFLNSNFDVHASTSALNDQHVDNDQVQWRMNNIFEVPMSRYRYEATAIVVVSKDLLIVKSDEAEVEGVRWRWNELWNGQEEAPNTIVPTGDSEQLVDVAVVCAGPGFEGSNAEVKVSTNNSRKVRLLSDVINSLQTPEEKRKAIKKGHGRPRKSVVSNAQIADTSLSDLDLGHVQLMESEWRRIDEKASMPVTILEKLQRLKSFLKVWNRESFGSVDLQIEVTTDLLNDLDERVGGMEEV